MESKSIIFGICGLVLAGGGGIVVQSIQAESLKADVHRKEAEVNALRQGLVNSKSRLTQNQERLAKTTSTTAAHLAQNQEQEELEREVSKQTRALESAKGKWDVDVQMMLDARTELCEQYKNQVIPSIPLKTGEALKDCRIMGIKDGTLLVQHSAGTARLTAAQLNPKLQDLFRLDFSPILTLPPDPDAPKASHDPATDPLASLKNMPPPEPKIEPPPSLNPAAGAAYVAKQQAINNLRAQIASANNQIDLFRQQASDADTKFADARTKGRISSQSGIRDKALTAVTGLQNQINGMEAQIQNLELEIQQMQR